MASNKINLIAVGDVVQIDPTHDDVFAAAMMVVTEVKSWGLVGYVTVPGRGLAFYRVPLEKVVRIGHAEWMTECGEGG